MKHLIHAFLVIFSILFLISTVYGADLNLTATWTANTESDMKEYKLYRTDITRILIGTIPHSNTTYDFTTIVPDNQDYTLTFVLTAVDIANNESGDSNTAPFVSNLGKPAAPGNLGIQKKSGT